MMNSPTSSHIHDVKGLFHTGIFLRPRIATSLQGLIRNKTIQDRAKFTVAKSQIHPNGLCEIVVKRQDPTVSTNAIMELLERCRKLVEEHILPEEKGHNSDLNKTIDVSDNDDSICIVSPSPSGGRKISFKRTLPVNSTQSMNMSPINQSASEPLLKRQNLIINVNSQPSTSNQDRKVVLSSKDSDCTQPVPNQLIRGSPLASFKGENIVVKVLNNNKPPSLSQCDDADSSVVILDVIEDAVPSAPTWTTSQVSTFPLNSISQNLGKNLAMDVAVNTSENPSSKTTSQVSTFPLNSISQNLGKNLAMDVAVNTSENQSSSSTDQQVMKTTKTDIGFAGIDLVRRFSDVVKENCKPKGFTSVQPTDNLAKSKSQLVVGLIGGNSSDLTNRSYGVEDLQHGDLNKTPNASDQNVDGKIKEKETEQISSPFHQTVKFSFNGLLMNNNQSGKEIANGQIRGKGSERASSSASGELSSDDEIIIEKEFKGTNPPSLIIEDSDDDIAVCEVVKPTVINQPLLSKNQKRKLKKKQLETSVPSTSSGPALDYIPLFDSSHLRKRHKNPTQPQNLTKASKFQKIFDKKQRKARALLTNSVQSGKVDSSSEQKQPSSSENKEKREFGSNIINPNPENPKTGLRPVVIDASNVAIAHGRTQGSQGGQGSFSVRGLKICVKYFTDRGHKVIAFAPKYRRFHVSPEDRKAMDELETQGILSFTPSRTMENGQKIASYDDRYIVQVAAELGGVIISTDNYRDLLSENEAWRETIEQRLLMFTWVGDMLLFPNDPLGRTGPHLQDFLRFPVSPSNK